MSDEDSTNKHWRRVEEILDAVLELPADQRRDYVNRACCGDSALRSEVEALLRADERAGTFLESAAGEKLGGMWALARERSDSPVQTTYGPYRVTRELGRGGMGVVYLAERADGQFQQRVALKVIKRGLDTEDIHRRFLQERQILARLEHPHIARLLDGGVTDDDLPYFALEFVRGTSILEYCDRHHLRIEERLRLFEDACSAVQYAHRNLVVHRDLKPSNILVTDDGVVKLLDFGIAKLLQDEGGTTTTLTTSGSLLMTPDYAAPEQLRGNPVTTGTDVYALGVVVYELLTGCRPYRRRGRTPADMERAILETEPERPSVASGNRRLRGDLDTIILKALRKEPEDRYASVEALLADLRRHRTGQPILATAPTLRYRARKFIRRHQLGVAAVVLTSLSLIVGVTTTHWQARQIARQAGKTEAIRDFLVSLFEVSDPELSAGREITARELLDRGVARVETELSDEPELRAEMLHVLGAIHRELGMLDRARSLQEQALGLRRNLLGENHVDTASCQHALALVLTDLGEYEDAEAMYRGALAVFRAKLRVDPRVSQVINDLANLKSLRGEPSAAEALYRESLTLNTQIFGAGAAETAHAMINVAGALVDLGRYDEAERLFRDGSAIERRILGNAHLTVAGTLSNFALLRYQMGDVEEAAAMFREGLAIRRRHFKGAHPAIAESLSNLAAMLHKLGRFEEAEPMYREALAMRRELLGADHPRVAITLTSLATLLFDKNETAEAERLMREALAMQRASLGNDNPYVAMTLSNLGSQLLDLGRSREAAALFEEALPIFRASLPDVHPRTANALTGLGRALGAQERFAEAHPLVREAVSDFEELYGKRDDRTLRARGVLEDIERSLAASGAQGDARE